MSHEPGTYLGGIRDLATLRGRCWCDPETKCWHFRTARGRPMAKAGTQCVWISRRGSVSVIRASWEFFTGKPVPDDVRVYRACSSYDCINPAHLRAGSYTDMGAALVARGVYQGPQRAIANRINGAKRRKVDEATRQKIAQSTASGVKLARELGISATVVYRIRAQEAKPQVNPIASIFALGQAAANGASRAAA